MEVKIRRVKVSCCPSSYACPNCGKPGRRKQVLNREVRSIAFGEIKILDVSYAEYRATCDCCRTFRSSPPGIDPRCHYDNQVRDAVLVRLIEDGMNIPKILAAMKRDFLLDLSEGFAYDCVRRRVEELDQADYRRWTVEQFSGTLCIDELHLGRYTLLLATDPIGDFPVAFALIDNNDQEHMHRFLANLKQHGFEPRVVVTDGSPLYPKLLAELWPNAEHQLCVFHVLQDINGYVLDAVKRMRREMKRRGQRGRKRRRGRPKKSSRQRRGPTLKDKSHFIFKHRHLIVTKEDNLSETQREHLRTMFEYLPALRTLRDFITRVWQLFEPEQTPHQAHCRRSVLIRSSKFAAVSELSTAMKMLNPDKFSKMIAFLRTSAASKIRGKPRRRAGRVVVRTNNHVERTNRKLRFFEKSRYKWRRRRNIVRFLLLAFAHWREKYTTSRQRNSAPTATTSSQRKAA
jgi:transposase-like protein